MAGHVDYPGRDRAAGQDGRLARLTSEAVWLYLLCFFKKRDKLLLFRGLNATSAIQLEQVT